MMMENMEVTSVDVKSAAAAMPEVEIRPGVPDEKSMEQPPQPERPDSASSVSSTTSSMTSNTKRSNGILVSQFTIDNFYSHREGVYESAISDCKTNVISAEEDGELLGSWLLTEIDQWDCEQEKIVLLTEKTLFSVRYNFVTNSVYSFRKIDLKDVKVIKSGDFVYPTLALMSNRDHGGVRVCKSDENSAWFFTRWNFAGAGGMPYWTFTHHKLAYSEEGAKSATYNCDTFHDSLVDQALKFHAEEKTGIDLQVVQDNITIYAYTSLSSAIYNQSSLGYSKDRRGVNY